MSDDLVYVKKHTSGGEVVLAICDYSLLGKKIVDREKNITLYIDPNFYKGEVMSIKQALELLKKATNANLIGNNIVEAAIREGYVLREAVIEVGGVLHAQLMVVEAERF
ncbi:MAG: hypothetical protein B6U89_06780 [Desulfurococcales archaeon ex4484_58]|nr:MAG: hypothetical protein B6U89_06780 [Desulfurococcales archaeon ex4484_58]